VFCHQTKQKLGRDKILYSGIVKWIPEGVAMRFFVSPLQEQPEVVSAPYCTTTGLISIKTCHVCILNYGMNDY